MNDFFSHKDRHYLENHKNNSTLNLENIAAVEYMGIARRQQKEIVGNYSFTNLGNILLTAIESLISFIKESVKM